ncbi:hypothetical protein ACFOPN_06360 [Xanthomonas hyacinthi]|uniref:hypothetical protein n=1 Tax=Xanthomonas hyacinthi TaxID=56455 RepID=UPI003617363C
MPSVAGDLDIAVRCAGACPQRRSRRETPRSDDAMYVHARGFLSRGFFAQAIRKKEFARMAQAFAFAVASTRRLG